MQEERFGKGGLIAIAFALIVIASIVAVVRDQGDTDARKEQVNPHSEQEIYLYQQELVGIEMEDPDTIESMLVEAFEKNKLIMLASWDVPGSEDVLTLASPALVEGENDSIYCHFQEYAYCGLYYTSASGTRLLVWGDPLTGFTDIERFLDPTHFVLATSWSFYNYSEVRRDIIDTLTGSRTPELVMELDRAAEGALLQVSGYGEYLALEINGELDRSQIKPIDVVLKNDEGEIMSSLDEHTIQKLTEMTTQAIDPIAPIFLKPSYEDTTTLIVQLDLYGKPFELDLQKRELRPLVGF